MYYLGWDNPSTHGFYICYAESKDGLEWEKPSLGIVDFKGSSCNNIIAEGLGGAFVMKDTNPDCPADELYKMFGPRYKHLEGLPAYCDLVCFTSADGIHFKEHHIFEAEERYKNMYDSLNTVYWDDSLQDLTGQTFNKYVITSDPSQIEANLEKVKNTVNAAVKKANDMVATAK